MTGRFDDRPAVWTSLRLTGGRLRLAPALVALVVLAAVGCGTAARPGPVTVEGPGAVADTAPSEAAGLPRAELRPMRAPLPRPWLPVGLHWSPTDPREGEAVFLSLLQPETGRAPLTVEAVVGGRPVPLARTDRGWFGVAPIPIGEGGATEVELRFGLGGDSSVVQRAVLPVEGREFPSTR
ncbi:MAG TPA: hypothetical protein VLL48_03490, partial [Longimicrobiales bacterium]|nr:hypothetical protein [Longimicrobiales bacterium]